jgi:leader peptidase (prepilin peptidase)/N-methyltransferase
MIPWDLPQPFVYASLFILGAVIGSFLNVCVYRFPQHETVSGAWRSLLSPPSSCPYCRRRIWAVDNVPIFGWLWLRGRCRFCRHRISMRYPAVELLNGLLFVGVYWAMIPVGFGATIHESGLYTPIGPWTNLATAPVRTQSLWLNLEYLYFMVLIEALLVASLIDIDLKIIPDSVTLPAMAVGLLGSLTGRFWLVPVWFQNPQMLNTLWSLLFPETSSPGWWNVSVPKWCAAWPMLHGLSVSVAGLLIGGAVVWFVRIAGAWVFRREAMGFGDVILMALIGSFLGWQATILVFFLAPICALLIIAATLLYDLVVRLITRNGRSRSREIPFGPYLGVSALWVLVCWRFMYRESSPFFNLGPLVPVLGVILAAVLVLVLWMVQGGKWLIGIPLYEPEWTEQWTSADQLSFLANKDPRDGVGPMLPPEWPGAAAGQGTWRRRSWRGW